MTDAPNPVLMPEVRKGQGDVTLSREEFARRLGERFYDPAFDALRNDIDRNIDSAYVEYRRSPRTRKAGYEFADPELSSPLSGSTPMHGLPRPSLAIETPRRRDEFS